jgi:catechol 1,2-dioxygenase
MIRAAGFKTQYAQVYSDDDPNLDSDVQFAVTRALVGRYVRHEGPAPAADVEGPWYTLAHAFVLEPGASTTPRAPITGKATERPALDVLLRHPDMR